MAKKKIGEIYNKPIVIGDKNLMNSNEIHIDDLKGSGGDSSGDLEPLIFHFHDGTMYSVDFDAANNEVLQVSYPLSPADIKLLERGLMLPDTYGKDLQAEKKMWCNHPFTVENFYFDEIYESIIDSDGNYAYIIEGSDFSEINKISCKEYSFNVIAHR